MIKINIEALRVFNSLYKLGITEQEFTEIREEQKHEERTGLSINLVKKGKIIGVSHDEKQSIVIKKVRGDIKPIPKSRILFKTLITFKDIPEEIYTLHAIAQYHALDTTIKYTANTIEELKDRVCDRFIDRYPKELGEKINTGYSYNTDKAEKKAKLNLIQKQIKALFWLFDEDFKEFKPQTARKNVARIIKVFQRNNRRLAIIQINEKWERKSGGVMCQRWIDTIKQTTFKIVTFTPKDERFNFVSPNREIFLKYEGGYSGNSNIWLDDKLFEKVTAQELSILSNKFEDEWVFLTADEYNKQSKGVRLELMNARRKEQEDNIRSKLEKEIKKRFKKGKVVRQGITLSNTEISYQGVSIKGKRIGEYIAQQQIHLLESPNFNEIFEGFIDYILDYQQTGFDREYNACFVSRLNGKQKIEIHNTKIVVEKKGNLLYVNGKKINQDDVGKVLKNAITYNTQAEYDEWVSYTSRVNLRLQEALNNTAMAFELHIDNTDDNCLVGDTTKMSLSIPIRRENNKNYVKIGNKEYKVKNIQALFDLGKEVNSCKYRYGGGGYLQRTIKLLYKAIADITPKAIGELIKNGKKEYRLMNKEREERELKRINRSKEFIKNAVKLTKAKKVNGGYFVKGLTKITYFVDERSLEVYTIKNGKQDKNLCIVDNDYSWERKDDEALRNDRVAKRLLMLSKDKKVAKEIYDTGDKVDQHWRTIQENKTNESVVI